MREAGLPRGGMGRDGMGEQSPRPPSSALPVPRRGASAAPTAEPDGGRGGPRSGLDSV